MRKRVLVVDDCADTCSMYCQHLENLGAEVVSANNGVKGVETVRGSIKDNHPFNLIILDVRMPEMNGFEAAKKIREAGFKGTIAACTAVNSSEDRNNGIDSGVDVFLDKLVLKKQVFEALLNKR